MLATPCRLVKSQKRFPSSRVAMVRPSLMSCFSIFCTDSTLLHNTAVFVLTHHSHIH